jgi:hypothetical protein
MLSAPLRLTGQIERNNEKGRDVNALSLAYGCLPALPLQELQHSVCFIPECRIHETLRVTPAMEAEISDYVWDLDEIIGLLEPDEV